MREDKPLFKFSAKAVAGIYNTISMVLSHYIEKESISVQRMIGSAQIMRSNHHYIADYAYGKFAGASDILYTTKEEFKMFIVFSDENPYAEFRPSVFTDSKATVIVNIPKSMIYNNNDAKTDYNIMKDLFTWILSYIAEDLNGGIPMMRMVEFFSQITIDYNGEGVYTDEVLQDVINTENLFMNSKDGIVLLNADILPDVMERLIYE